MAGWVGTQKKSSTHIIHGSNWVSIAIRQQIKKQKLNTEQKINDFFTRFGAYVYIGVCLNFAIAAAKYTPPNMGKGNIDSKYYNRPIYSLSDLAKGLVRTERGRRVYATKEDFAALRAGFKYKVVNTKYRLARELKNKAVAYTRGINEAKRAARIENRGLSKYSWGANLNNIEEDLNNRIAGAASQDISVGGEPLTFTSWVANKLPPIFSRLATKSPNITKYVWGSYYPSFEPSPKTVKKIKVIIVNRLAEIQRYGSIAIKQGIRAANKYATRLWRGIASLASAPEKNKDNWDSPEQEAIRKLKQSMGKLFDDTLNAYQIERIVWKQNNSVPNGQFVIRRG